MDQIAFDIWLGGIAALTEPQRRLALRSLALSEAGDCHPIEARAPSGDSLHSAGVSRPAEKPAGPILRNLVSSGWTGLAVPIAPTATSCVGPGERPATLPLQSLRRTFNALTKTPLANLRMKEKWAAQTEAMIDGVSTAKAAARCGVHYTTAFRWRHRFLASLAGDKPKALAGIVEGDETFILELFKGKRSDMPRKSRKRGGNSAKRGLSAEQIPVIVARDRQGARRTRYCRNWTVCRLRRPWAASLLQPTSSAAMAARRLSPSHAAPGSPHTFCRCPANQPQAPDFHLNNVNAYHGRLKEWLRRFHGVATKNLPNYLGWRRTLEALGTDHIGRHDPRRYRTGTISTDNAIRAVRFEQVPVAVHRHLQTTMAGEPLHGFWAQARLDPA